MLVERKEIKNKEKDNIIEYVESVFNSSNVLKSTYFIEQQRLYIAFNRGNTYSYEGITNEMYELFENAESQGQYFNKNIKGKFDFRKEFTLYPNEVQDLNEIRDKDENDNI